MNPISYQSWENCYHFTNGVLEIIVLAQVGPRILHFGLLDQENEFWVDPTPYQPESPHWQIIGGHRLWHSPEEKERTYVVDHQAVKVTVLPDAIRVTQPIEEKTWIEKEIEISFASSNSMKVTHRLWNRGVWSISTGAWAITVMAPQGVAILPIYERNPSPQLPATHSINLWSYTNMTDPRWYWGKNYILLQQSSELETPQKVGIHSPQGWGAYARNGHLFLKTISPEVEKAYPDCNSSFEIYTNQNMLELETLSPLTELLPNECVEHIEHWYLFEGIPHTLVDDEDIETHILPLVQQTLQTAFNDSAD